MRVAARMQTVTFLPEYVKNYFHCRSLYGLFTIKMSGREVIAEELNADVCHYRIYNKNII